MSRLGDSVKLAMKTLQSVAGETVSYWQAASQATFSVRCVPGESTQEDLDATGLIVNVQRRQFLISVADLSATPERGDRIAYGGVQWEVMGSGDTGAPYTYSDQENTWYRVRTQYVPGV